MTIKKIVTGNLSSKNASEDLSTADAFSLLSKQLDNALQQQKREIFSCCELSRRCKASGKFPAVTALLIRDKSFETLSLKSH
jgi:hypothetical protein